MNQGLEKLHPYPFEKLMAIKADCTLETELEHIALSIGEPKHPTPEIILNALKDSIGLIDRYPVTKGIPELRQAICDWLSQRFGIDSKLLDAEKHVVPVTGTREALFAFAQCMIDSSANSTVIFPNPFYQIYEGAALLAGAIPYYLPCLKENGYIPDLSSVPSDVLDNTRLVYICTPGNPTGAVYKDEHFAELMRLAEKHDFIIASDECYSEIYFDEDNPPEGLLGYAAKNGNPEFKRCMVFHSLSKRSNAPGLRSGFVAGDAELIASFLRYRTYHGCAMSLAMQHASIAAWQDESHVFENREKYREKFQQALNVLSPVLDVQKPDAGFYLWPDLKSCDIEFAKRLYSKENVTVLPGSFLSREHDGITPGKNHVRIALVAETSECLEAAQRIKRQLT